VHFSKDHLGTESDRNRKRALKSQPFLALSVVTRSATCARLKAAAKGEAFSAKAPLDVGQRPHSPQPTREGAMQAFKRSWRRCERSRCAALMCIFADAGKALGPASAGLFLSAPLLAILAKSGAHEAPVIALLFGAGACSLVACAPSAMEPVTVFVDPGKYDTSPAINSSICTSNGRNASWN
jgi:hypothetical protein